MKANLKRGQQHPLKRRSSQVKILSVLDLAEVASFNKTKQPGSADHPLGAQAYYLH
jgi:hypothetical protein